MALYPYLNFGGNCREAFARYQEIFGGELALLPFSEMPSEEAVPAEHADLIMHAALKFGEHLLMASDDPSGNSGPMQGMYANYTVADVAEAERVFEALAEGGKVEMPLAETFFAPRFGLCTDRFGTPWMIMAEPPEASS